MNRWITKVTSLRLVGAVEGKGAEKSQDLDSKTEMHTFPRKTAPSTNINPKVGLASWTPS